LPARCASALGLARLPLSGCSSVASSPKPSRELEPFEALIGTWATEATHPLVDEVVPAGITFESWEGGHFLIQRSRNDHELFPPDAVCVIGASESGEGPAERIYFRLRVGGRLVARR
jgi:hypothetical protein